MIGGFAGDLGVGVVTGIRRWAIESDGLLRAVSWDYVWTQGENVARHMGAGGLVWECDQATCVNCGFYAYFNDQARYAEGRGGVVGIIEGYGHVIIGTRGFRAQKARIVALAPSDETVNPEDMIERVAAQYPEIPIFPTRVAMLTEYPTDQVEMPPDGPCDQLTMHLSVSLLGFQDAMTRFAEQLSKLGVSMAELIEASRERELPSRKAVLEWRRNRHTGPAKPRPWKVSR